MRKQPILIREAGKPIRTVRRWPTDYEKTYQDRDRVQLATAILFIGAPLAVFAQCALELLGVL